jgi:hypothetical protein
VRRIVMMSLAAWIAATSSASATSFKELDSMEKAKPGTSDKMLKSMGLTLAFVNGDLNKKGQKQLFCWPSHLDMTADKYQLIMKAFMKARDIKRDGQFPVEIVLMSALKWSFPCEE